MADEQREAAARGAQSSARTPHGSATMVTATGSRPEWDAVRADDECEQLRAQVEAMRPVVDAAREIAGAWRLIALITGGVPLTTQTARLVAAIEALDAGNDRPSAAVAGPEPSEPPPVGLTAQNRAQDVDASPVADRG